MDVTAGRRFRRRGGAKKKKKERRDDDTDTQAHYEHGPPAPAPAPAPTPAPASSSFAPLFSAVPPDLLSYLQKVSASLREIPPHEPGAAEAAGLLARNALTTLAPNLADLSREPTPARILQSLVSALGGAADAGGETVCAVLDALLDAGLPALATHICASRVLQDALLALPARAPPPQSLCDALAALTLHEFAGLVDDRNASHVLRACFAALAGIPPDEPPAARLDDALAPGTPYFRALGLSAPSRAACDALSALAMNVLSSGDGEAGGGAAEVLAPLVHNAPASAALQGFLSALSFAGHDALVTALCDAVAPEDAVASLVASRAASRLIDRILLVASTSRVHAYFADAAALRDAVLHPVANFPAQRYLAGLPHRAALGAALSALEESVPRLLSTASPREGVVLALARAAEAVGDDSQRLKLARAVARAVGATAAAGRDLGLALALRGLRAARAFRDGLKEELPEQWVAVQHGQIARARSPRGTPRAAPLGTLLARSLLRMPGAAGQPIRDALASLTRPETVALLLDGAGSRLLDGWIASGDTGGDADNAGKAARKAASKILGTLGAHPGGHSASDDDGTLFAAVCATPCAAIVAAHCVARLGNDERRKAMQRLAGLYDQLACTPGGEALLRKARVEQFMKRSDDWEREETTRETRQRLFADIVADGGDEAQGRSGVVKREKRSKKEKKEKKETKEKKEKKERKEKRKRKREAEATGGVEGEATGEATGEGEGVPELPPGVVFDVEPAAMEGEDAVEAEEEHELGTVFAAIETLAQGRVKKEKKGKHKAKGEDGGTDKRAKKRRKSKMSDE